MFVRDIILCVIRDVYSLCNWVGNKFILHEEVYGTYVDHANCCTSA